MHSNGGRGRVLPYISHIGICCPNGEGVLGRFGLKMDVHFPYFGLELGIVFLGITGVYEHSYQFNSK